ncbi:Zinc finger protein [Smittium mucronatum]|uniref:Zinc finger protein n=1 Tax=Smittium mucronatum TaxID=133383 RepID=A0A1R0GXA4_9FUNG|nr:Zinc finger protein [Smittium mucronatum]
MTKSTSRAGAETILFELQNVSSKGMFTTQTIPLNVPNNGMAFHETQGVSQNQGLEVGSMFVTKSIPSGFCLDENFPVNRTSSCHSGNFQPSNDENESEKSQYYELLTRAQHETNELDFSMCHSSEQKAQIDIGNEYKMFNNQFNKDISDSYNNIFLSSDLQSSLQSSDENRESVNLVEYLDSIFKPNNESNIYPQTGPIPLKNELPQSNLEYHYPLSEAPIERSLSYQMAEMEAKSINTVLSLIPQDCHHKKRKLNQTPAIIPPSTTEFTNLLSTLNKLDAQFDNISESKPFHQVEPFVPADLDQWAQTDPSNSKKPRKYTCKFCLKRFSRPSSLKTHVYIHTGEKPFKCSLFGCTKSFSVLSNLRRHYKVHTNPRKMLKLVEKQHRIIAEATSNGTLGHLISTNPAAAEFVEKMGILAPSLPTPSASKQPLSKQPHISCEISFPQSLHDLPSNKKAQFSPPNGQILPFDTNQFFSTFTQPSTTQRTPFFNDQLVDYTSIAALESSLSTINNYQFSELIHQTNPTDNRNNSFDNTVFQFDPSSSSISFNSIDFLFS